MNLNTTPTTAPAVTPDEIRAMLTADRAVVARNVRHARRLQAAGDPAGAEFLANFRDVQAGWAGFMPKPPHRAEAMRREAEEIRAVLLILTGGPVGAAPEHVLQTMTAQAASYDALADAAPY